MPKKNDLSQFKKTTERSILPKEEKKPEQKPKRKVMGAYISTDLRNKFDQFVLVQKQKSGKNAPALMEEAINLLFEKYNFKGLDL